MSMRRLLDEDRRLVVLRSLRELGGSANESVLQACLEQYGHNVSRDTVRNIIVWLDEQNLVRTSDVAGCLVAKITGRGEEVATGRTFVMGVKKPRASDYDD